MHQIRGEWFGMEPEIDSEELKGIVFGLTIPYFKCSVGKFIHCEFFILLVENL